MPPLPTRGIHSPATVILHGWREKARAGDLGGGPNGGQEQKNVLEERRNVLQEQRNILSEENKEMFYKNEEMFYLERTKKQWRFHEVITHYLSKNLISLPVLHGMANDRSSPTPFRLPS